MAPDVFKKLGEQPVPDRPAGFRRELKQRLNVRLTALHIAEVAACLVPYAFTYFFTAMIGAVAFTITGRYPHKGEDDAKRNDPNR